jgi:hypothetical protein
MKDSFQHLTDHIAESRIIYLINYETMPLKSTLSFAKKYLKAKFLSGI